MINPFEGCKCRAIVYLDSVIFSQPPSSQFWRPVKRSRRTVETSHFWCLISKNMELPYTNTQ